LRLRFRLTPNRSRVLYDLVATLACAAVAYGYAAYFLRDRAPVVFLSPLLVVACNRLVGIYTRLKIGAGPWKALWLTVSVLVSGTAMALASRDHGDAVLLWAALVIAPLTLPRLFLNLPKKVSIVGTAIKSRGPVLVVGGAGYIGTCVVEQLLDSGRPVRVLDRLIYGKKPLEPFVAHPHFQLVDGDATDIVKLVQATQGAAAVVHLAGLVGDPACAVDDAFTRHANVITTRMVKEVALSLGVQGFVFASSCSVYGATDVEVDETSPLKPVSLYARTKIDSERELLLAPDENFFATVLRFATVFGHSRRPRFDLVANLFTAQAFTDGEITVTGEDQWRPFIHVRDLARSVRMVLDADPQLMRGQVFNVGDRRLNRTIGDLAITVQRVVSTHRPVSVLVTEDRGDRRSYAVSFEKIRRVLGFEASVQIEDGVREILEEFKKGTYGDYKDAPYSNLEMTRRALSDFHDPALSVRLYGPLAGGAAG
jgi:nucleoside-diphosphate-sugar epimerase